MSIYNDIGTAIESRFLDTDGNTLNVSLATAKEIRLKRPDGVEIIKTAIFATDGTDGKIRYLTVDGDLTILGLWSYQGRVVLSDGSEWAGERGHFVVDPLIGS
jgi:hypothetical protein